MIRWLLKIIPKTERKIVKNVFATGAKQDALDHRDFVASSQPVIPERASLLGSCPPIRNQGVAGACTGESAIGIVEIDQIFKGETFIEGSVLYNYYRSRLLDGFFPNDSGAYLRDAIKVLNQFGFCPEKLMPYNDRNTAGKPGIFCDSFAKMLKIQAYFRCINIEQIKSAISQNHAVAFALNVYGNFYDATDTIPMPSGPIIDGHAMIFVAYDDTKQALLVRNSWDVTWGDNGYSWMPYEYLNQVPYDAWFIVR